MIVKLMRRMLLALMCLAACATSVEPPAVFMNAMHAAGRGVVVREANHIVESAVPIERGTLPRAAAVTIAAVQPEGAETALAMVWRQAQILYRATTHYADPAIGTRTVLVDGDGNVVERAYELATAQASAREFTVARDAALQALGTPPQRWEIVHDADSYEWLRATAGNKIAACAFDGRLRHLHSVEAHARDDPQPAGAK